MAGNFCKSCQSWDGELFTRVNESFGICQDPTACSKIVADVGQLEENSVIYTEAYFGCVYYRARPQVLIDIKDILKDKL